MKLKYCCYAFCIISSVTCMKWRNHTSDVSFVNYADQHLVVTKWRGKRRKRIWRRSYENGKRKEANLFTRRAGEGAGPLCSSMGEQDGDGSTSSLRPPEAANQGGNQDDNHAANQDASRDSPPDGDILKRKGAEKEVEKSVVPLNMDWVKVMNLIYASRDVDATTLAFNAAMSAVEKKGCLKSMLEVFEIMKKKNIKPDLVSYKLLLRLCANYHLGEHAEILFDEMVETDKLTPTYEIYALMISCFAKVGDGHRAVEFVEKLRSDPLVGEVNNWGEAGGVSGSGSADDRQHPAWRDSFAEEATTEEGAEAEGSTYTNQFKEITKKIKHIERGSSKIQYSEYANVIFACNMSNLPEQGIKYFEELLNTGKYMPSTLLLESIFDLLAKNGNYEKCLDYYNKLKDDPNFKKAINVNILNNILKALSVQGKINIIEDLWKNEFDELMLTPNEISYGYMLKVYSIVDDYEKAFKLFKEMQMKKMLSNKNIIPFVYTINAFKNCGIYNYAIYVLRVAKLLGVSSEDLLKLYNDAMVACVNAKKYDVVISLYAELITMQEKGAPSLEISISTLGFVLLAFRELDMREDFTNLKNLIIQKNYKLTPLCGQLVSEQPH
ncbi:PPR repeat protein [Plasmodium vivax]|uniref:PPR repeat protein n=1 Tax=Plasmodium vivax TaxID=5855 RepID=A0A1G4HJ32_PLAVI|nr:PPR repeat protein [Plasmodium vivax]